MKYLGVAGVLLGLSLLGVPALADEAKQPVPRVGQVVIESMGPASGTIPKGKLATIVNYIHADKHTWYKNGSRHTAKYPFNKGTQRNLHDRFVLKMRYGLGDGYDVRFATPIVMNNFRAHSTLTPNSVSSKNGIGDTTFVLHKQFLSQREGSPVDMAWDLGVWTPTGGTSDDGVGTGAWGAMAGLGVGHALAHALGGRLDLRHGMMHSILLPAVMRFNVPFCREKMATLLRLLSPKEKFLTDTAVLRGIRRLEDHFVALGSPARLRHVLPDKSCLREVCEAAANDACMPTNPRPASVEDLLNICDEAW